MGGLWPHYGIGEKKASAPFKRIGTDYAPVPHLAVETCCRLTQSVALEIIWRKEQEAWVGA